MSLYFPQAAVILRVRWEDFGKGENFKEFKVAVVPRRLVVTLNDYTTANTFECELDYRSLPFDPRTIRACGVEVYLEDQGDFVDATGRIEQIKPSPDNLIFQGFADEETLQFDDDKRMVKFEGRDYTALLIDAKYLVGPRIDTGLPLDQLITQMLATLPAAKGMTVSNRTPGALPALAQFYPDFGNPLATAHNTSRDQTYWEIIQDLVAHAGLICYVEFSALVLSTPRILYDRKQAKSFVYGNNVKTIEFKRKLGRHKGFNVRVRCMSPEKEKGVIQADIPREATEEWAKSAGISAQDVKLPVIKPDGSLDSDTTPHLAPFMAFRVTNIANKEQLIDVGQKIFEELSRQQLEGSLETYEMEVMDKDKTCFDLTKLRVGMPLAVEIDSGDLFRISRFASVSERTQYLIQRNYPKDFAVIFAQVMGQYAPVFYTKSAQFNFDQDQGFKLKIDFINFIDIEQKGISLG